MEWPESWKPVVDPREAAMLQDELTLEVSEGHLLYGLPLHVIGRHWKDSHYLFAILDGSDRVAIVDLQWKRKPLIPPLPPAFLCQNAEAWSQQTAWHEHLSRLKPDPAVKPKFRVGDRIFMTKCADWKKGAHGTIVRVRGPIILHDGSTQVDYEIQFDVPQSDLTDELHGIDMEYSGTTVLERFLRPLVGRRVL